MVAPTVVQSVLVGSGITGAGLSVVLPAAPTPGNTLLLFWWRRGGTTETPSVSPAFTQLTAGRGYDGSQYGGPGSAARVVLASRLVGVGDTNTITVNTNGGSTGAVVVEVADGAYPPTVVDNGATGQTLTSASTLTLSSTVAKSALMVAGWGMQRTDYAPADSVTPGSGVTEMYDQWVTGDNSPHGWVARKDIFGPGTIEIAGTPVFNPNLNKWGTFAAAFVLVGALPDPLLVPPPEPIIQFPYIRGTARVEDD